MLWQLGMRVLLCMFVIVRKNWSAEICLSPDELDFILPVMRVRQIHWKTEQKCGAALTTVRRF